jgi:hypothetical protein
MTSASPWLRTRHLIARLWHQHRRAHAEMRRVQALRDHCHDMIRDLGPGLQMSLGLRIAHAQDANDIWHLRALLFGAIALEHGEREAEARLQHLDSFPR